MMMGDPMIHREEKGGGRLETSSTAIEASCAASSTCQKYPRRSRLIMDDGPPHGPGTTDPSSDSKPDPAHQSPGAAPLPLGTSNLQSTRNLPLGKSDFQTCWI